MLEIKTEAESVARAIELGIIDVAHVVSWADQIIAEIDVPPNALCDISLASKAHSQDVAHLLREIPGSLNCNLAVVQILRLIFNALTSGRRTPECIAEALFQLALAGSLPPGRLKDEAFFYWDLLDHVRNGYVKETSEEIVAMMISALSETVNSPDNCQVTP
jgi:hypothetical protein